MPIQSKLEANSKVSNHVLNDRLGTTKTQILKQHALPITITSVEKTNNHK